MMSASFLERNWSSMSSCLSTSRCACLMNLFPSPPAAAVQMIIKESLTVKALFPLLHRLIIQVHFLLVFNAHDRVLDPETGLAHIPLLRYFVDAYSQVQVIQCSYFGWSATISDFKHGRVIRGICVNFYSLGFVDVLEQTLLAFG